MNLANSLSLIQQNEIPVLELDHPVGKARIALQGAQLLSWQPRHAEHDIFWLSPIEPFKRGVAIRGGVPICYPWFGTVKQPAHGTARLQLWTLSDYDIQDKQVILNFSLFDEHQIIQAHIQMTFSEKLRLEFTHYGQDPAQIALHSYFNLSQIENVEVQNLPMTAFDKLTDQQVKLPTTRQIQQGVDCIYPYIGKNSIISDRLWERNIEIDHQNADSIVLWNPWNTPPSAMQPNDYQHMVCVETARLHQLLSFKQQLAMEISVVK